MNLILMGYRCTGKTSTGQVLAKLLGMPFVDTDAMIEQQLGRSIPEVVAEKGWPFFRAVETEVVVSLSARDGQVLALGGGAVLELVNVAALKKNGFFVWLTADVETICRRMEIDEKTGAPRPSLTGKTSLEEIEAVLAKRTPLYGQLADLTIDTTAIGPLEVAERIREGFAGQGGDGTERPVHKIRDQKRMDKGDRFQESGPQGKGEH